jgi:hypothetical protein
MDEEITYRLAPSAEDYVELRDLSERTAAGTDHHDKELYLSAYAKDARYIAFVPGKEDEPEIDATPEEAFDARGIGQRGPERRTIHMLGNTRYEVNGDEATGEIYHMTHHLAPTGFADGSPASQRSGLPPGSPVVQTCYHRTQLRFRKVGGHWRITEARVSLEGHEIRPLLVRE